MAVERQTLWKMAEKFVSLFFEAFIRIGLLRNEYR